MTDKKQEEKPKEFEEPTRKFKFKGKRAGVVPGIPGAQSPKDTVEVPESQAGLYEGHPLFEEVGTKASRKGPYKPPEEGDENKEE